MPTNKVYVVISLDFPEGTQHVPVEIPEGLNKEETRVFTLGASQGVLTLVKMALGEDNIQIATTAWDETNLPENGTIGLSQK